MNFDTSAIMCGMSVSATVAARRPASFLKKKKLILVPYVLYETLTYHFDNI